MRAMKTKQIFPQSIWKNDLTNLAFQRVQFFRYYESRGFKTASYNEYLNKRFLGRPFFKDGEHMTQYIKKPARNGELESSEWECCPTIIRRPASAKPSPHPFVPFVPFVRPDNEEGVESFDKRQITVKLADKNIPDPVKETEHTREEYSFYWLWF
jgi:hypothetical protein